MKLYKSTRNYEKKEVLCSYCKKPVILIPSASERARKFGGVAEDYIRLFPNHTSCVLEARRKIHGC